jgi:hypothetical protein
MMKFPRRFLLPAILGVLSLFLTPLRAENGVDSWISLFDGETLGCWEGGGEAGGVEPKVKDGCLVIGMGSMSSGIKFNPEKAEAPFPSVNYEIEYTAKRQLGNDFFAAMTFPCGESCCTLVNGGWGGTLFGLSSIDGMDASENNYSSYHGFKNKTWYVFRIRVTEKTITVWLDEEKKIEVYTENHRISIRMEMNRYKPFGIASWVSEGWVKSIRYRHLTDDEAHDIDAEADRQTRGKLRLRIE